MTGQPQKQPYTYTHKASYVDVTISNEYKFACNISDNVSFDAKKTVSDDVTGHVTIFRTKKNTRLLSRI